MFAQNTFNLNVNINMSLFNYTGTVQRICFTVSLRQRSVVVLSVGNTINFNTPVLEWCYDTARP